MVEFAALDLVEPLVLDPGGYVAAFQPVGGFEAEQAVLMGGQVVAVFRVGVGEELIAYLLFSFVADQPPVKAADCCAPLKGLEGMDDE